LADVAERGTPLQDFEVEHDFPAIGVHTMVLSARRMRSDADPRRTVLLSIEDITARRQAERELRVSEEIRYRRLFETSKDGIVSVDADSGQITNANPFWAALIGRAAETLTGRRLWEIGAFEDVETIQSILRELQGRDFVRYDDLVIVHADGTR